MNRWLVRTLSTLTIFAVGTGCLGHRVPAGASPLTGGPSMVRAGMPAGAKAVLSAYAQALEPELRGEALSVLVRADVGAGGGVWATAGVWDPDPWVQARVVEALSVRLDESESVGLLAELAGRPEVEPYTRCRAARYLPVPVPASVREVTQAGWQRAPLWKAAPCALTSAEWGDKDAAKKVAQAVAEGAVALDAPFLGDLAVHSSPEMIDALKLGLVQADELLRPAYAKALLVHGDSAGLDVFSENLDDDDPLVRLETVLLLADAPATADVLLARAAQLDGTPEGVISELTVAARQGGGKTKLFELALLSDNRDVRAVAVSLAGLWTISARAGGRSVSELRIEKLLATAVVDPEVNVQRAAVEQIGRLQVVGLAPLVDALLEDADADPFVRVAAAEAAIALAASRVGAGGAPP